MAEFDADIVRRGTHPHGSPVVHFRGAPEADVMPFARAVADGFFKGEIFLPPEKIEIADGRAGIGFVEDGIEGDRQAAVKTERVGGTPASGEQISCDHTKGDPLPAREGVARRCGEVGHGAAKRQGVFIR